MPEDAGTHQSQPDNKHGLSNASAWLFMPNSIHASPQGNSHGSLFPQKSIPAADFSHLPGDQAARLGVSSGKTWKRQLS